jgi:hypothetical protein
MIFRRGSGRQLGENGGRAAVTVKGGGGGLGSGGEAHDVLVLLYIHTVRSMVWTCLRLVALSGIRICNPQRPSSDTIIIIIIDDEQRPLCRQGRGYIRSMARSRSGQVRSGQARSGRGAGQAGDDPWNTRIVDG